MFIQGQKAVCFMFTEWKCTNWTIKVKLMTYVRLSYQSPLNKGTVISDFLGLKMSLLACVHVCVRARSRIRVCMFVHVCQSFHFKSLGHNGLRRSPSDKKTNKHLGPDVVILCIYAVEKTVFSKSIVSCPLLINFTCNGWFLFLFSQMFFFISIGFSKTNSIKKRQKAAFVWQYY